MPEVNFHRCSSSPVKDAEHAKVLRERFNACFELANLPETSEDERRRLLNFVVVSTAFSTPPCLVKRAYIHRAVRRKLLTKGLLCCRWVEGPQAQSWQQRSTIW